MNEQRELILIGVVTFLSVFLIIGILWTIEGMFIANAIKNGTEPMQAYCAFNGINSSNVVICAAIGEHHVH